MREAIRDYLSIGISIFMFGVFLYGWTSNALDDRINVAVNAAIDASVEKAVNKAMAPFVVQLKANTQTLKNYDNRFKSLEDQVASIDEVEF